jgi:hypothetical protein
MRDKPVALVTGANQGIGLQIARELVAHGLAVLVGSRNFERGLAAAQQIGSGARVAPQARIVNVSSGAGSLTLHSDPTPPVPVDLRPRLPGVQNGPQRIDSRHGDRVGAGGDQGQRRFPGLHQDVPLIGEKYEISNAGKNRHKGQLVLPGGNDVRRRWRQSRPR